LPPETLSAMAYSDNLFKEVARLKAANDNEGLNRLFHGNDDD
jgi:hypothetical protein